MPEHIDVPPMLMGDNDTKIMQLRSYLFNLTEVLNRNLQSIGGNELTDRERAAVQGIIQQGGGLDDVNSLLAIVVRLAETVKKEQQTYQDFVNTAVSRAIINATADRTTTETDMDEITSAGNYWIDIEEMENGPGDLTEGIVRLEIVTTNGIIQQRIWRRGRIYLRTQEEDTWTGWYRFSGTAVT